MFGLGKNKRGMPEMPAAKVQEDPEAVRRAEEERQLIGSLSPDAQSVWRALQLSSVTQSTMRELIDNFNAKHPDNKARPREGGYQKVMKRLPNKEVSVVMFSNGRIEFEYSTF